jgi:hypothetical protein
MNKENNKIIDIGVEVEDNYINNDVEWMAKIVDAAHKHDTVTIKIFEPVAIEELNYKGKRLLAILDEVCATNRWDLRKFHFETTNLVQDKSVWPSINCANDNEIFLRAMKVKPQRDKSFDKTFGVLVNRSNWDRLLISSYLFFKHKEKTFQRYCNDLKDPMHMLHMDFDRMLWYTSSAGVLDQQLIEQVMNFMKQLPLGEHVYKIIKGDEGKIVDHATSADVTNLYSNFFVDIVCEKMNAGQVLYLTEKTARPIMTMNPFIINASVNHLSNLKKLGFKTFSKYWSEDYDYQNGIARIMSINNICDDLSKLSPDQVAHMYKDMIPTLEHNRRVYESLTQKKIKQAFINLG